MPRITRSAAVTAAAVAFAAALTGTADATGATGAVADAVRTAPGPCTGTHRHRA